MGRKAKAKPPAPVVRDEPGDLLLGVADGAIVRIGGRIARVAWKYNYKGAPISTSIRWAIGDPPYRWSATAEMAGDVRCEIVDLPTTRTTTGSNRGDVDPMLASFGDASLFDSQEEEPKP